MPMIRKLNISCTQFGEQKKTPKIDSNDFSLSIDRRRWNSSEKNSQSNGFSLSNFELFDKRQGGEMLEELYLSGNQFGSLTCKNLGSVLSKNILFNSNRNFHLKKKHTNSQKTRTI